MNDYLDWGYDFNPETKKMVVEPCDKTLKPISLYKYYPLSKNSVDALTNLYVYASHPYQLNDPFDCDMDLAKIETEKDAKELWEDLYDEVIDMYGGATDDFFNFSTEAFSTLVFSKQGILSLAHCGTNLTMWSLYTGNTGFCLEFDISKFTFDYHGPFPIHYVDNVVEASSKKYDVPTLALIQSNVKNKAWQYEKEWRLLIQSPKGFDMKTYGKYSDFINQYPGLHDRKFKYPINALKSVTLGIHFFKSVEERQKIVSISPYEIHVCYEKQCKETEVLNFLSKMVNYTEIKMMVKKGLSYLIRPITIIEINELTYRIIEK